MDSFIRCKIFNAKKARALVLCDHNEGVSIATKPVAVQKSNCCLDTHCYLALNPFFVTLRPHLAQQMGCAAGKALYLKAHVELLLTFHWSSLKFRIGRLCNFDLSFSNISYFIQAGTKSAFMARETTPSLVLLCTIPEY